MRHWHRSVLLVAAALVAACDPATQPAVGPDARRELARAHDAVALWVTKARTRADVDATTAVAVGYLERLRLGLGSPFRLADHALRDPRLPDSTRARVAWALLGRTLERDAYEIDPLALDRIGLRRHAPVVGSGRLHLDLIEGVIRQSSDPRGGELAVRLAYMLAAAAGDLGRNAPEFSARAAALIRDRELARRDVARLLNAAEDSALEPLALLARWRVERRFEVERPAMAALPADAEFAAMELAPRLARVLRALASGQLKTGGGLAALPRRPASLLGPAAATRLAGAADSITLPPETPVAVAAMLHKEELLEPPWITPAERAARTRFLENAHNSEQFAAELARLTIRSPYDAGPSVAALAAAVALRAYAQEPAWLPGDAGPSLRELQERYGLASITFGDDVPAAWRPYYRRLLDVSLADLSRVLPALNLTGLGVHFSDLGRREATLALHDPRQRRLVLPPSTAAGTLAHEIAHDLDWQVALRRYRVRGDYASDRAVRLSGDRFAEKFQDLGGASMQPRPDPAEHASRPAEVFARSVEWFVAVSLAADGRTNGYLSSVQDEMLTGYGSVRAPDITGTSGNALISILDEVAPLYPATREWFVKHYGLSRSLTPHDLVRRVLGSAEASRGGTGALARSDPGVDRFTEIEEARDAGFAAIDAWVCRAPGATFHRHYESARRQLVLSAAAARARGTALQIARQIGGLRAERWVTQQLDGEPGPHADEPDAVMRDVLGPIVSRARDAATAELPVPRARIEIVSPPRHCEAAPLRLTTR